MRAFNVLLHIEVFGHESENIGGFRGNMPTLHIEYGERDESDYSEVEIYTKYLIVNGEHAHDSLVSCVYVGAEEIHYVALRVGHTNNVITSYSFGELPVTWRALTLPLEDSWSRHIDSLIIALDPLDNSTPVIQFFFDVDWANWFEPWTINEYAQQLEEFVNGKNVKGLRYSDVRLEKRLKGFEITCEIRSVNSIIGQEVDYWSDMIRIIVIEAETALAAQAATNAFVTRFAFPPIIKNSCEQYLLYFVQFLSDIGIEAEANINHQAQDVLFSVIPKDKDQALSTIQDALTAYLSIPSSPTFATDVALSNDIAVKQLEANVYHLKGQIVIAQAVLQAKDATIDALQLINFQQKQMLDVARPNDESAQSQNESVMDGIVQITPYEGKGFIVDLPKLIRRLKRSFLR